MGGQVQSRGRQRAASCGKEEGADEIELELWVGRRWGTSSSSSIGKLLARRFDGTGQSAARSHTACRVRVWGHGIIRARLTLKHEPMKLHMMLLYSSYVGLRID
jgi:hypothetical protein